MTIVIEIDSHWAGFYVYKTSTSRRLGFGYIAITLHPFNIYDRVKVEK